MSLLPVCKRVIILDHCHFMWAKQAKVTESAPLIALEQRSARGTNRNRDQYSLALLQDENCRLSLFKHLLKKPCAATWVYALKIFYKCLDVIPHQANFVTDFNLTLKTITCALYYGGSAKLEA